MSLELMIYIANVSSSLSCLFGICGLTLFIICVIASILYSVGDIEDKRIPIYSFVAMFISLSIASLLPSEKTIYAIAAIKMGKELSKNEKVIETSDKVYKLLNQKLDELIDKKEK